MDYGQIGLRTITQQSFDRQTGHFIEKVFRMDYCSLFSHMAAKQQVYQILPARFIFGIVCFADEIKLTFYKLQWTIYKLNRKTESRSINFIMWNIL